MNPNLSIAVRGIDEEDFYDEDITDAAPVLTGGDTTSPRPSQNGEDFTQGYTESDDGEHSSSSSRRAYHHGEVSMTAETCYGSSGPYEDASHSGEDYPMSFVEQARSSGLCNNYLTENPLESSYIPSPPETVVEDLADPPGVQSVALLGALNGANIHEKWDVDKETAGFLASVLALGDDDGLPLELEDTYVSFRDLKLPEPLLHCDPELELQDLRRRNQVKMSGAGILPFTNKDGDGEAMQWSEQEYKSHADVDRLAASEKLDISLDVSSLLKDIACVGMLSDCDVLDAVLESDRVSTALSRSQHVRR